MIALNSDQGLAKLGVFCRQRSLIAFDFDGTLAAIAANPTSVTLPPDIKESLVALSELSQICIISGRSLQDLCFRVNINHCHFAGNHGAEQSWTGIDRLNEAEQICTLWLGRLSQVRIPGVSVENKQYSLSIHFRGAPDQDNVERQIKVLSQALEPLPKLVPGHSVLNLIPDFLPNKGQAILALLSQLSLTSFFFLGDDETDEDVFALASPQNFGVRVGYRRGSCASYFIESQGDVAPLLARLVTELRLTS